MKLRKRLLTEVEHGEELARGHQHVITEPPGDHRVVHDGLVRLVLEVGIPTALEVRRRPLLELLELLRSRADLHAGLDAVRGKGASTIELPLVEDL